MRLFAILLLVLVAGLGFALWQGIDLGAGRLAEAPEEMAVEEVELTAADPEAAETAPEEAPVIELEAVEPEADEAAEAPAETAPTEAAEAPAETAAVEAPASPETAPEAETVETPAAEAPVTETAEATSPEPATETPEAAEAPAPRTLPEDPLDPTDALAEIAPDLSVPSAPPVRSAREPAEEPAAATTEPAAAPSATNLASAASDTRRLTADRVNLRQGPDAGTASLGLLSRDETVEVLESDGDWLRVRTREGEEGWVAARFLAAPPG